MTQDKSLREGWKEKFDIHFFGTDRSPHASVDNESVYVYAVKKFISQEIQAAKYEATQAERKIWFENESKIRQEAIKECIEEIDRARERVIGSNFEVMIQRNNLQHLKQQLKEKYEIR